VPTSLPQTLARSLVVGVVLFAGSFRSDAVAAQHTSGVVARVGIEAYPVGCTSSRGNPTDSSPWTSASGSARCSTATQNANVDGLMILVTWKTLQPNSYNDALSSYYVDNAIYSLAHPERQSIHLAVMAGTHSPDWLINPPSGDGPSFPNRFASGTCNPSALSSGGPSPTGAPGTIWNVFQFSGTPRSMPNPFGSNSCLFTALDILAQKLGQTGDYNEPGTGPHPAPLAPYDDLYYDSAPGASGFVHTLSPTPTMNKIVGHVSVLGPHSYDGESVLCQVEADCENLTDNPQNGYNVNLWRALEPDDASMESAIEDAQIRTIDIYAARFPNTYWTVDLVETQMPFFSADGRGCAVASNPYPPTGPGPSANDRSDCFGKLRSDLIGYIQTNYPSHGGVQNNSLDAQPNGLTSHPVWLQTALAAQEPPSNDVRLFVGLQVGQPSNFYQAQDKTFADFEADDQTAVDRALQMAPVFVPVDFIEFYDVDVSTSFTLPALNGGMSAASMQVNKPASALNDDPDGVVSGGFMFVPLTRAHLRLREGPSAVAMPGPLVPVRKR
jgi:hypothetical protein